MTQGNVREDIRKMLKTGQDQVTHCPDQTAGCRTCANTKAFLSVFKDVDVEKASEDDLVACYANGMLTMMGMTL